MKASLKEALAECLARLDGGASIDECLRGHEALAGELRPLLEAAQAVRGLSGGEPSGAAFQRGRARMHSARVSAAEGGRRRGTGLFWRPAGVLALAAVVAVLAALGFTTGIFDFGAEPTSAQVDGVVSRADPDAIILVTPNGNLTIRIGDNTIVLDASGQPIGWGDITPGRTARIEVEEEGGEYSAQRIEVDDEDEDNQGAEVEFKGVVMAVSGSTVTVKASFGTATVVIGSGTEVKGKVGPGATVEVHAVLQQDNSYLAKKIEVKKQSEGPDGDHGEATPDSSGSGSGDDSSGPGGGGSSGSGSDDEPDHSDDD